MTYKRYYQTSSLNKSDGLAHGILPDRPPSDAAVKEATDRYVQQEKDGLLDNHRPSGKHWE